MTVCIAAICDYGGQSVIVGASDRLVTFGDVEYEQFDPKILKLASHTVALIAGSPEDHMMIQQRSLPRIRLLTFPTVEQIANIYADEFANLRRLRAEKRYLWPLGLSIWSFLNSQINLNPTASSRLAGLLEDERLNSSAIITGADQFGAHVYVVADPGEATCYDLGGWAAIGSGRRHANLQFIEARYHPRVKFEDAFLMTYLAKKKADITPGVGASTDLFWITPGDQYRLLEQDAPIVVQVRDLHKSIEARTQELIESAKGQIREFVKNAISEETEPKGQQQIEARDAAASATVNPPTVSGGTEEGEPPIA
jgi:20S proteasome alpha/beta subunit